MTITDEIPDNQEVAEEARFLNDFEFELQPLDDRFDRLIFIPGKRRQSLWVINAFDNKFLSLRTSMNAVAFVQTFGQQLAQITFAREMLRRFENRIVQFI